MADLNKQSQDAEQLLEDKVSATGRTFALCTA